MDRALGLKPEVTQGCGFESRLWQEVSMTEVRPLSKAPNPQPSQCRMPTAPLGWVKCREHSAFFTRADFTRHYTLYNCVCCSRGTFAAVCGSLPFAAISMSSLTFAAHVSPPATASTPTEAHVPLGLLVAYEGMCWSPAFLASVLEGRLFASALQCPCWFRPALQSTPESQRFPSAPKSWSRPLSLLVPPSSPFVSAGPVSPCIGRGSQWGCSYLDIRLGKSGYHQHSCDRQFGSFSLFDIPGLL